MPVKTRLKWKKYAQEKTCCDFAATLVINKHLRYQLTVEIDQIAANKVSIRRMIWANDDDNALFDETRKLMGKISDFARELKGLEWNMLSELNAQLRAAMDKIHELTYEKNKERP